MLSFRSCLTGIADDNVKSALDVLKLLAKFDLMSCFPDLVSAYVLFLTLPVSVASDERSFSKLKIIKNYLRATMTQYRLSDLGLLSIEANRFKEIKKDRIIRDFANAKARKVHISTV